MEAAREALVAAAQGDDEHGAGDLEAVLSLLDQGVSADNRDDDNWTAINWAAFNWNVTIVRLLLLLLFLLPNDARHAKTQHLPNYQLRALQLNASISSSIASWNTIDTPKHISVTSMSVEHHSDGSWFLPSFHERNSIGWNRTMLKGKLLRPFACSIRFYALGLESTLQGFIRGGTGYMSIEVKNEVRMEGKKGKPGWYGFDKNETSKLHCYYMTNKDYGSEFIDTPKTLGIAIYCPVLLDLDAGEYNFRQVMQPGYFCRSLADEVAKVEISLRPSSFQVPADSSPHPHPGLSLAESEQLELKAEITTNAAAPRLQDVKDISVRDPRPHAVCTVQTFRNHQTGPMLFLFTRYYQRLGWRVIIYDRFGLHRDFVTPLLHLPGVDYHPYTIFQLVNPAKYNLDFAAKQGTDRKFFYAMEKNWGYSGTKADTADQDQDKTKTYDHCRVEYAHLDMLLYVDADEFFFCPQAAASIQHQREYQQRVMGMFSSQGVEEMRFVRIPYSGLAPAGFDNSVESRSNTDFTNHTQNCMLEAYARRDETGMFRCWSSASSYDNFPKSADFASVCPFHYNHWSCSGMKNGGRDLGKNAPHCRCKVAFDMINGFAYKPLLKRCHLLHFNDNKYRFQSKREKHVNDKGSVLEPSPIYALYLNQTLPAPAPAASLSSASTSGLDPASTVPVPVPPAAAINTNTNTNTSTVSASASASASAIAPSANNTTAAGKA